MNKLAIVFSTTLVFITNTALAQDSDTRENLLESLEQVLPRWNSDILKTPDSTDWTQELTVAMVVRALGAQELIPALRDAPNGTEMVKNKAGALQVDAKRGYVRYANNSLIVDLQSDVGTLPNEEQVFEIGMKTMSRLGVPIEEFARPEVATQVAAGGSIQSDKPERIDELYQLFLAKRSINNLPVFGSTAMLAVTDRGEVQRLKTQWPTFRMDSSNTILEREEVLNRALDSLVDQGLGEKVELSAEVGYAPVSDIPGSEYIPVVLIAANDGPTPVLISVPLVAPGDSDDR